MYIHIIWLGLLCVTQVIKAEKLPDKESTKELSLVTKLKEINSSLTIIEVCALN